MATFVLTTDMADVKGKSPPVKSPHRPRNSRENSLENTFFIPENFAPEISPPRDFPSISRRTSAKRARLRDGGEHLHKYGVQEAKASARSPFSRDENKPALYESAGNVGARVQCVFCVRYVVLRLKEIRGRFRLRPAVFATEI